jgi:hypothetical protein|tara:strand:- start:155 stop:397 length:243 start_codon:yes stop_codon:yes gene_type:complete
MSGTGSHWRGAGDQPTTQRAVLIGPVSGMKRLFNGFGQKKPRQVRKGRSRGFRGIGRKLNNGAQCIGQGSVKVVDQSAYL